MNRRHLVAFGLAATAGLAGLGWWQSTREHPSPGLRDPARIEAALNPAPPAHAPFRATRHVLAKDCPLPGELATPELPAQSALPAGRGAFRHSGGRLQPLAGFSVDGRVLSTRRYTEDREAEFAPIDIALGWGRMRDDDVLAMLDIGQQNRWYFTRWDRTPPITIDRVRLESANMHMIPANHQVASALAGVVKDQRVRIDGWLVEVQARDGWRWRSSTRRDDHGPGGCEVIYVCGVALE